MSVPDRSFVLTRQLLLDDSFREQLKAELGIRDPTLERIRDRVRERRRAAGVEQS